jgi:hypothetical protein
MLSSIGLFKTIKDIPHFCWSLQLHQNDDHRIDISEMDYGIISQKGGRQHGMDRKMTRHMKTSDKMVPDTITFFAF